MASEKTITEIVHENPDAVEEALYGHLAKEDITGRKTDAAPANTPPNVVAPAAADPPVPVTPSEPLPNPVIPPALQVPVEPIVPPAEPAEPVEPVSPAPVTPPTPVVPTPDPRASWKPEDRRAAEIKERNPDIELSQAIVMARNELGITDPDPDAPTPDPVRTNAEQLTDINARLKEAGAAEGLWTPEIAELTQEQARLSGLVAVESAEIERQNQQAAAELNKLRLESFARVIELVPTVPNDKNPLGKSIDENTPIGRAMSAVLSEMTSSDHPDLYEPNAHELILAKANLRLPEAERVETKRPPAPSPAPAVVQPPTPPSAAAPVVVEPTAPAPSSVLPVPASARSAQPASINPADIGRITKEMTTEELEKSLYGSGPGVLLRM